MMVHQSAPNDPTGRILQMRRRRSSLSANEYKQRMDEFLQEIPRIPDQSVIVNPTPLGKGSFGIVEEVYTKKDNKRTRMARKSASEEAGVEMIFRQAAALRELLRIAPSQDYYPRLIGFEPIKGMLYQESLHDWITLEKWHDQQVDKTSPVYFKQLGQFLVILVKGVSELHQNGIAHCDLKPANIMVRPPRLKIIDFGGACLRRDTGFCNLIGTPDFMSPELRRLFLDKNRRNSQIPWQVMRRADVWALGLIIYKMLYGALPPTLCHIAPIDQKTLLNFYSQPMIPGVESFPPTCSLTAAEFNMIRLNFYRATKLPPALTNFSLYLRKGIIPPIG